MSYIYLQCIYKLLLGSAQASKDRNGRIVSTRNSCRIDVCAPPAASLKCHRASCSWLSQEPFAASTPADCCRQVKVDLMEQLARHFIRPLTKDQMEAIMELAIQGKEKEGTKKKGRKVAPLKAPFIEAAERI
ncbi:uncharacterized protein [Zea mays]|uniref:uncharacterized protein isoform X2 n=1 Tax=Zea mays TaxID=4577 RepID=UPI0009AACD92|nr:uncharacterized protein LOC118472077 isoform X2 [Zea mays]|eukprot:XP_020394183.1 uncharacterized protein LOC109939979 [Zea mays]